MADHGHPSWTTQIRSLLAQKNRLRDWQMLSLYITLEVWTIAINMSTEKSYIYQMFFGGFSPISAACVLIFLALLASSNVLYVTIWLQDPGYVIVLLLKEQLPPRKSDALPTVKQTGDDQAAPIMTETAGLLKRNSVPNDQVSITVETVDNFRNAIENDSQYCFLCDHTTPPRSHHCRQCDRCVAKYDHHCPFLNACIGARTHHLFVMYCFTQSMVMLCAAISSYESMDFFGSAPSVDLDSSFLMWNCLYLLTTFMTSFLFIVSFCLWIGHMTLTMKNRTTWECIVTNRVYSQRMHSQASQRSRFVLPAKYDQGIIANMLEDCSRTPRSEFLYATRRLRHNTTWGDTDDVEIDVFDSDLDNVQQVIQSEIDVI
uniref:Palmitoyltransferase n=1 Tax=Spongospora subterranea TaxID=70186 RepID=A0A0H5R936_9EUKA|eukprot:CRZ10638.1 hypothetical protein [Spongospora subterranea]